MGRWSHLDADEERLPDGMARVGYDADTQSDTFRDTDGSLWRGAPGCQHGKLFRVKDATPLPSVKVKGEVEGDEPDPVVNEGEWELPADDAPTRGRSFVKKVIKRLNSVKRSRADTAASAHDSVVQQSHSGEIDDDKPEASVTTKSTSSSRSPTGDEKQHLLRRRKTSDGASSEKTAVD